MSKVLFVTNAKRRCGVYQFGKSIFQAMSASDKYCFQCFESEGEGMVEEFIRTLRVFRPDIVIYNWYPSTMSWVNDNLYNRVYSIMPQLKHVAIVHDFPAPYLWINGYIHIDPSYEERDFHFRIGRLIPEFIPRSEVADNIIGSFGFGFKHKNFHRIVQQVNTEYDHAIIRFHLSFSAYGDPLGIGAKQIVEDCRKICKPGISIEISHQFLDDQDLLTWLSQNSVNCFFFDKCYGAGISSSIDWALGARRPIAITNSYMFRHIAQTSPSILIEETNLRKIIENGTAPLKKFYQNWNKQGLVADFERILGSILSKTDSETSGRMMSLLDVIENLKITDGFFVRLATADLPTILKNTFVKQAMELVSKSESILLMGNDQTMRDAFEQSDCKVTIASPNLDLDSVYTESKIFGTYYDLIVGSLVLSDDQEILVNNIYDILKPEGVALISVRSLTSGSSYLRLNMADCRLQMASRLSYCLSLLADSSLINYSLFNEVIGNEESAFFCLAFKKEKSTSVQPINPAGIFREFAEKRCVDIIKYKEKVKDLNNHIEMCLEKKIEELNEKIRDRDIVERNKYLIFSKIRFFLVKFPRIALLCKRFASFLKIDRCSAFIRFKKKIFP